MINIDKLLHNADWPKRTPDTFEDLGVSDVELPDSEDVEGLRRKAENRENRE